MKIKSDGSIKSIHPYNGETKIVRPVLGTKIPAGFPSPALDYMEERLDIGKYLVPHPTSTYFVRVEGYSMINAGIFPDDILVVDRSLDAVNNKIVIAIIDGELTVKRLKIIDGIYWLCPENDDYKAFKIDEDIDFYIWGVVTYAVHKV